MNKYTYNFLGTIYKVVGFGKSSRTYDVEFRETKNHYIAKDGTKFSKKSLYSLGGYKYKGVFLGEQIENIRKKEEYTIVVFVLRICLKASIFILLILIGTKIIN